MRSEILKSALVSLAVALLCGCANSQPPPIPAQEQPEVLTRGPVHEAFSEPVILQNQEGLIVPNEPPSDIDEVLPADRPRGDQYVWVPGYWSWDGDRNNFIWVSGCWRAAPPNMSWVPGYWSRADEGWEWVAGFWTPDDTQDFEYLPPPPQMDDEQAIGSPPSQNVIWVPSCPYWYQDHYVERPGYWLDANADWVWTPSHYVWTPRGYVFCDGHWDYPLQDRGVLFAPVYFPPSVYGRRGYSYSPTIVIDLGVLTANLFTYPRYSHYYFGDYYDNSYISIGIYPRIDVERIHTWYDPTFTYDRWHHRGEPGWAANERHEYDMRHTDKNLRPPRTYQEMETRQTSNLPEQQRNNFRMAEPLKVVVAKKQTSMKFEQIDTQAQQAISKQTTAVHSFRAERNRWEARPSTQQPVTPSAIDKGRSAPDNSAKQPATRVTTGDQRRPANSPANNKPQVLQPKEIKSQPAPAQRQLAQPERVKVPTPPITRRQVAAEKSPPPRPAPERKYQNATKVAPKNVQHKSTAADKGPGKSKDQGGDKTKDQGGDKGKDKGK